MQNQKVGKKMDLITTIGRIFVLVILGIGGMFLLLAAYKTYKHVDVTTKKKIEKTKEEDNEKTVSESETLKPNGKGGAL